MRKIIRIIYKITNNNKRLEDYSYNTFIFNIAPH